MSFELTKLYFVRHAQPVFTHENDLTRPLTIEGMNDTAAVLGFFKDKHIDAFISSPYKRSYDTILSTAEYFGKTIETDIRLREREKGQGGNTHELIRKRWADKSFCEEGGESLLSVQKRNIETLSEILLKYKGKTVAIGTHGTALSTILNHYDNTFGYDDFMRIIDRMPYIVELDFDGEKLIEKNERLHICKEFAPQDLTIR